MIGESETMVAAGGGTRPDARVARTGWPLLLVVGVFLAGIVVGRGLTGFSGALAADDIPDATATRDAELKEIDELRTKIAQPVVCTPAPTVTPTQTPTPEPTATVVPPQAAGTTVIDPSGLRVTVLSIQPVSAPAGVDVEGRLLRVNVELTNPGDSPVQSPFPDWRLVDESGNRYRIQLQATNLIVGTRWGVAIGAQSTVQRAVVFDVPVDAGDSFVLEHEGDPAFRIAVTIESRG